ncbi:MAG: MerR family transcriptional regulator [Pirellulales bacterium]|nr:MerR family transcriptional regulator [Pirellulales bacterium]
MTIGTLAKAAGVGVETVRFYQRKGLLEEPARTTGFRKYSESDVRKIKFVKRLQELGFSLKDAQELLQLTVCSRETRPLLAKACNEKIEEIEEKIVDLNRILERLHQFNRSCGSNTSNDSQCSLLDCFENNWECCDSSQRRTK